MSKMTDEELAVELRAAYDSTNFNWWLVTARRARELLASEAPELPPICGPDWTETHWREAFHKERLVVGRPSQWEDVLDLCARVAHRLAQPAPKIDQDAEAMRLCYIAYKIRNSNSKTINSHPITEWHVWFYADEFERNAWRAVAAAKVEGGG